MSGPILELVQGTDQTFDLQVTTDGVTASTAYLSTDTLTARMWPGGNTATLITPAASWVNAATAQFQIAFAATDTSTLTPALFKLQVLAGRAGKTATIFSGALRLFPAPGTGDNDTVYAEFGVPVYGTLSHMMTYASWITELEGPDAEAGFLRQRQMAREWIDDRLVTRYNYGDTAPMIGSPGFGLWSMFAGGVDFAPSKWLRDQLAANTLMLFGITREIAAKQALFYVCDSQLGRGEGGRDYQLLAKRFKNGASNLMKTWRAEIDLNADGYADIVIELGATNLR